MMKKQIFPVGALTFKPYSFTFRSWELKHSKSLDVFDSFSTRLCLDVQNTKICRIVPDSTLDFNNEGWITDRARFSADGHFLQRIQTPFYRIEGFLVPCSWEVAFLVFRQCLKNIGFFQFFFGRTCDRNILFLAYNFLKQTGFSFSSAISDLRSEFFYPKFFFALTQTDFCLVVGDNFSSENPLLFFSLEQASKQYSFSINFIGSSFFHKRSNSSQTFGLSTVSVVCLLEGRSVLSRNLVCAKNPIILISSKILRFFSKFGFTLLKKMNVNMRIFLLDSTICELNQKEVGFCSFFPTFSKPVRKSKSIVFALNDDLSLIRNNSDLFLVYLGSNGFRTALSSDLIFPSTTFAEKDFESYNLFGYLNRGFFAVTPPLHARTDWKILAALSESLGVSWEYPVFFEKFVPLDHGGNYFLQNFSLENSKSFFTFFSIFEASTFDLFKVDALTHSSKILSLASHRFATVFSNFF